MSVDRTHVGYQTRYGLRDEAGLLTQVPLLVVS